MEVGVGMGVFNVNLSLPQVALGSYWGHFLHIGVTLNDCGLTLVPLCGHLLALVGPSWAYKQQIHAFTRFLKAQAGGNAG